MNGTNSIGSSIVDVYKDKPKIAVIHNVNVHVEISVSIYFTLERSGYWAPTLILLPADVRGLNSYLDELNVRYLASGFSSEHYEKAIVITSYPSGSECKRLPKENHYMIRGFKGRRILVTHRADYPKSSYQGELVVGLTPLCERYKIPFIYACENPVLESPYFEGFDNKVFLIQGRFNYNSRSFSYIRRFLENKETKLRIRLLGESASSVSLVDSRVEVFDRVSEVDFYNLCRTSHFILPSVDPTTRRGQYLRCRFSSTYCIAFSSQKLLVSEAALNSIYKVPALTYRGFGEFRDAMHASINMKVEEYIERSEPYKEMRYKFRQHNIATFKELLA